MTLATGGAWDCHAHVIGDRTRYPLATGRSYDPPDAPLEEYLAMLDRCGIARGVLVQPSVYRFDNRCMLDALDRAEGRLVGVAVPDPGSSARDLEAMHRRGVRGVRCNLLNPGGLAPDIVVQWQSQLRELGWYVAMHVSVDDIPDLSAYLEQFEVPVVIDHMGRPDRGRRHVPELIECVRGGLCFVKLSAPYRLSAQPPPWADVTSLAQTLIGANASGCVWGSDWPHTELSVRIDEDDVFGALDVWCPEPSTRHAVMELAPRLLHGVTL